MNESAPKWEHHDDLSSLSYRSWIRPTTHEIKVLHIQNLAKAYEEAERVVHGHWDRFLSLCLRIDVAKKTKRENDFNSGSFQWFIFLGNEITTWIAYLNCRYRNNSSKFRHYKFRISNAVHLFYICTIWIARYSSNWVVVDCTFTEWKRKKKEKPTAKIVKHLHFICFICWVARVQK